MPSNTAASPSPMTAVILAAGAGSRLGDLRRTYSKPMVPVAGRPLIDWVIERLHHAGVHQLRVVRHPSDTALAEHLAKTQPDARLTVQPQRLGIADALRLALPLVADQPAYLACACDSVFTTPDLTRMITIGREHPGAAVIAVLDMGTAATASRSTVRLDGEHVVEIVEKPPAGTARSGLVAAPLYWLPQSFASHLTDVRAIGNERYVSTAINDFLTAGGQVLAVRISERIEITTSEDVERAALALRRGLAVEPPEQL